MRGELPNVGAAVRRLKNQVLERIRSIDSIFVRLLWCGYARTGARLLRVFACTKDVPEKRLDTLTTGGAGASDTRVRVFFFFLPLPCVRPQTNINTPSGDDPTRRLRYNNSLYVSVFLQLALSAVRMRRRSLPLRFCPVECVSSFHLFFSNFSPVVEREQRLFPST